MSTQTQMTEFDLDEFQTIDQFIENYPQFSNQQIRWWLNERYYNGFNKVVSKVGRRIYLHVPSFYDWLKGQIEVIDIPPLP